ncbi:MAG: choice-of-anchor D domain-containing protein [Algicola sp.]|nr:choice-of-anchor D domain-containing protein [Algicola sp.]
MKKNYALAVITFLCAILSSYGQVSDLIISEYAEGSSFNKYVEIYNGTGAAVDLSDYELWTVVNGHPTWPENTLSLSGILADGDTYVVARSNADFTITSAADLINDTFVNWNGDDAVGLAKLGVLIDAVGTDGPDPGSGWDVAGDTNATANQTLVRKTNTCSPNTNWSASAGTSVANSEWIVLVNDDWSDIGVHTSSCTDTYLGFVSAISSIVENGVSIAVCVEILNPSPSADTTVDITLNGLSSAINGTDYDDGAASAITFPQTLTFPMGSSANECLTIFIADDAIYEGDETVVLNLTNPTGGISASISGSSEHTLTIVDDETPVIADVIITEIMYNTPGIDDEWIEICNTTGLTQVLNNYSIRVQGYASNPAFTFPVTGSTIAPGDCITIALGEDTSNPVFNPDCPFTPDYSNGLGTANVLINSPAATGINIELIASDGTTVVDLVNFDDADGADGNGSSLHVSDDSLDNSDTGTNWQPVITGGSPGFNTLISQCSTLEPEINVEGDINTYPNISNNDVTPSFFDNTRFSSLDITGASETKSFRIQNIGSADLTVSNIEIIGTHAGDFSLTLPSGLPITVTDISTNPNNLVVFDVTFDPIAVGTRTATVRITNNDVADGEGEEVFEFAIQGEGFCSSAVNTVTPLSGPDNTVVTISGSDLDGSTAVTFAGSPIAHTVISPTEIEITIPDNAISGSIIVTNNIGCQTSDVFTVLDNRISSCEGTAGLTPTDLFISEVTDAPSGSHTYIEIFNGTGAPVNLADYEIRVHNNGSNNSGGANVDLDASYTMPNNSVYVIAIGGTNATDPEGGYTANETSGIPAVDNNDNIRLYIDDGTTETWIDVWGDYSGSNFTTEPKGYTYRRKNTGITVPRVASWNAPGNMQNDWDAIAPVDYTDIGLFDFSTGTPPVITDEPDTAMSSCDLTASFTLTANQGFAGGLPLAYQWFVSVPGIDGWSALSNDAIYSGVTTNTLNVSNTIGLDNYQYYCQVRENAATCYTASHAVRITSRSTTWVSPGTWDNGTPDINTITVIDEDYDTATFGSFSACRVIVNATNLLTISNNTFVEVENNVTVNGNILVQTDGSFVQNSDSAIVDGIVTGDKTRITVQKETAVLNSPQEYTYWSSPVFGETINDGLSESAAPRRFWYNGQNFRDSTQEASNDNTTVAGQDDIDDDGNDWQFANGATIMSPGVGYAATHSAAGFIGAGNQYIYTFQGPFNNGIYNIPIYRNDVETNDNNWNFIGNPYPSAIDADLFLAANSSIDQTVGATNGAIFFWSHNLAADGSTNGNEALNYAQSDYAIINGTGETAGGDMVTPDRFIPSGQGFFVSMSDAAPSTVVSGTVRTTDVLFNNSMRVTGNNAQFFRTSNSALPNKLKLNLTSDNGIFNQILIGYVNGATNDDDGMYYDAHKNLASNANTLLYSLLETNSTKKLAIQGKAPEALTLDEIIPLGFFTKIDEPTIYKLSIADIEGEFMTNNSIYLKDKLQNIIHNLSESDYNFTSETGEFNTRFEIVFQSEALSIAENEIDSNQLTIIELQNGSVKFSVNTSLTINTIEILDLLGRTLYKLKGTHSTEIFELNNLSQSAYIAKVRLSNGQTITKRAIKRN